MVNRKESQVKENKKHINYSKYKVNRCKKFGTWQVRNNVINILINYESFQYCF